MKGLLKIEKPQAVIDAAKAKKGMNILLEALVFGIVFLISTIAELIVMIPGTVILMIADSGYRTAANSGDEAALTEAANRIVESDAATVMMLFATIMMTLVVMLFCKLIQKRKMNTLGFRKKGMFKEYFIGLAVGFLIFSAAVLICVLTGSLKMEGFSPTFSMGMFLLFTVGFMIQGMAEEVLCRGYLLVSIGRRHSMMVAIWANALFFAALHLGNDGIGVLPFINLTLFGVFASLYFIKRDNIWGVGAVHSIWNLVQGNFYGIRVSGIQTGCTVFSSEMVEGKEFINGGAFGLEGGIAVTIVLVVGIVVLLFMKPKAHVQETAVRESETEAAEETAQVREQGENIQKENL